MKRRSFHKAVLGAAATAALPAGLSGCVESAHCRPNKPLSSRSQAPPGICDEHARVDLLSYGGADEARADLRTPTTTQALQELLQCVAQGTAAEQPCRVTFRAAGMSVGGQSVAQGDLVIDLSKLNRDEPLVRYNDDGTMTVRANACWGHILKDTLAHDAVPHILVSTSAATAGGTASANSLSRFSPIWGKESRHIRSIELVTAQGQLLTCSREQHPKVFRAAVGGFGCLGAITRVTYDLYKLDGRCWVATRAEKHRQLSSFVRSLVPDSMRLNPRGDDRPGETRHGVLFLHKNEPRGIVYKSRYVHWRPLNQYPVYWRDSVIKRDVIRRLSKPDSIDGVHRDGWNITMTTHDYVDPVEPYTFFQDSHAGVRFERLQDGDRDHITAQQTLIIPTDCPPEQDRGERQRPLLEFLGYVTAMLECESFRAAFIDVILIPKDDMTLSASNGLDGFAVSIDFERRRGDLPRIRQLHQLFAERCLALGGRLHLVKSLLVEPSVLCEMYRAQLNTFLDVKDELDPQSILGNEYIEKAFGLRT